MKANSSKVGKERCAPIVTDADGVPVYVFGDLYVYGLSPDFQPGNEIQGGNENPREKIKPKKPWEIKSNYFGVPAYIVGGGFPYRYSSFAPQGTYPDLIGQVSNRFNWPVNLIDGNPKTYWTSPRGGTFHHPLERGPISIRIDLPQEMTIKEVDMVTRAEAIPERAFDIEWLRDRTLKLEDRYHNPLPRDLGIMVSRDGRHWDTVYKTEDLPPAKLGETTRFPFLPRRAKQILLRGEDFGPMINPDLAPLLVGIFFGYCWSLAEIRVLDENGANVALASRGAGITVDLGPPSSWDPDVMNDVALACRYDLGVKWMRCSYHGGNLLWHHVEQERGEYVIDPAADQGVTEATENGITVTMGLMYGNWLYADPPRPNLLNRLEPIPFDPPPAPTTPEHIEAYTKWARFMVNHFKDRVKWWEIFNEASDERERYGFGIDREGARAYARLIKAVVPVIREADPEAKILIQGLYWPWEMFKEEVMSEVAPMVDALELPIRVYEASLNSPYYKEIPEKTRVYQAEAKSMGFKGVYVSYETMWFPEPNPPDPTTVLWGRVRHVKATYVGQAKNLARHMLQNHGLDVVTFWLGGFQLESGTLAPAYYVYRTLCTVMDGAKPAEVKVVLGSQTRFDHYGFMLPDGDLMVALWLPGDAVDDHPGETTDVSLPGVRAKRVVGIDTLNGYRQDLEFNREDDTTVVPGLVIRDYPLVLRVS